MVQIFPTGALEIESQDGSNKFLVNGQRLKNYLGMTEVDKVEYVIYLSQL